MSELAVKIEDLRKRYKLGTIGGATLNAELQSWWARKCGKEDPNLKIGQDYSKYGEQFYALNGINLEIKKGEAVGIIGSNGAGKSTLLKILSRVTAPTEGEIWINGRISSMLEVGTGFHPELTGRENIYMNGAILGMTKKEVDSKIESIIDFSECRQFIDTPVKRYSSGMYVKLAFAVASHLDAEILVMDEVLAVGDMKFQQKCLGRMGNEAKEGKTILYVSHNMETIRSLCDRCIVMNHGKIVYDGDVEQAILIYMDSLQDRMKDFYDFKNAERGGVERTDTIEINSLEFTDGAGANFTNEKNIGMKINISFSKDVADLRFAFQVMRHDMTRIGIAFSDKVISGKAGERKIFNVLFDGSMLVDGVYSARIWVLGTNEYGTRKDYDKPLTNIYFRISNRESDVIWTHNWGNLKFNPLEIRN